jgi:S-adenosylmethionine synthetase
MAVRRARELGLTVAVAFVDRFISSDKAYFDRKAAIERELADVLSGQLAELDRVSARINTLDDPARGLAGMYLTVLGTSAEGADGGEVGRGNRVNGVISLNRPMTTEAAAGKNPVSHVGKIYNVLSHELAARIYERVGGINEAYVWMCSQIGRPLHDPWCVAVQVSLDHDCHLADVEQPIRELVADGLRNIDHFVGRLCRGEIPIC